MLNMFQSHDYIGFFVTFFFGYFISTSSYH